jgi:hypothetical protein
VLRLCALVVPLAACTGSPPVSCSPAELAKTCVLELPAYVQSTMPCVRAAPVCCGGLEPICPDFTDYDAGYQALLFLSARDAGDCTDIAPAGCL